MTESNFMSKAKKQKKYGIKISDFIIPIIAVVIFIILIFTVLAPMIGNIEEMLLETEEVRRKQERLEKNVSEVRGLDYMLLQNALGDASKVLPRSLEVAQYAYYVDSLAEEKGLEFRGIKAEDVRLTRLRDIKDIQGVDAPLEYRGSFEDVVDFFDELQSYAPYIISMGDIDFRKTQDVEDEWRFEITVTGYYSTPPTEEINADILVNLPFLPYNRGNEHVTQDFSDKAKRLELESED